MHVSSPLESESDSDPNWNSYFQFLFTAFIVALGFLYILRTAASNYFHLETNFNSSMGAPASNDECVICAKPTSKQCSGCKAVKYCSQNCQTEHWKSGHRSKCMELKLSGKVKSVQSPGSGKRNLSVALVPSSGADKTRKLVDKVLFPYDEFVKLFNWDREIFPPCGLLNCGNSCFANVILQCLAHTRPLLAYLLEKGHRRDCKRNDWCFLCELQTHMERASRSQQAFSPINILSRLPSIGANLGYGRQEDAHEFMRFAIDTMQSVCLDEHGGEKVIHSKSQETTLIQHIFGGQLQSQVICTKCHQVSNQYENMMDLTVEIQGDATSLEECLDQFTAKEWLHGENMYKCDGCNDYVSAWKRLSIHQAPNILTIALKRFQSGRFGKINKRITFPERLDLTPFMSEGRDGTDKYKLYAVVVHVDMLNASFFGHYICYTKGFQGDWYRIDDCKVTSVDLDEVLSQGAYMLLYSRVSARPACLKTFESASPKQQITDNGATVPKSDVCSLVSSDTSSNSSESSDSNCSSSQAHLLLDHNNRQSGHTDTPYELLPRVDPKSPYELLPRVDPKSVNGSQEDSHSVNHISVEANGHDASHAIRMGNSDHHHHHQNEEQSFITLPLSYGSSASGENTDDNVTVNGISAESNGKVEKGNKSEDEHQVVCECESGNTQEVSVDINGNGCAEFSQERSIDIKRTDEMDVDIRPGNVDVVSDDMDVDAGGQ